MLKYHEIMNTKNDSLLKKLYRIIDFLLKLNVAIKVYCKVCITMYVYWIILSHLFHLYIQCVLLVRSMYSVHQSRMHILMDQWTCNMSTSLLAANLLKVACKACI